MTPNVSVLIPVYNEEKTIALILQKVLRLEFVSEVVVVDDGSKDRSFEIVKGFKDPRIKAFRQPNAGKSAAIREAVKHVTAPVCIIQDADLEYDPDEIEGVVSPILLDQADVVYGSRFMVKKASRVLYFYHYLANKFLTGLSNTFTNLNMSDIETGYKAMRSPILTRMPFTATGFGMEVEVTAMIGKLPVRVYEVPISYYGRTYEEGKKIGMKDGIAAILYIAWYNLVAPLFGRHRAYLKAVKADLVALGGEKPAAAAKKPAAKKPAAKKSRKG